ncbi:MAG: T9SS type A sorting domain-containing protein [Ferruginibacter sp.]|nr:T9SS type A sorting domain-containing protein [Ferruginibacter sp.]
MKNNKNILLTLVLLCLQIVPAFAQSGLTVSVGSSIFISNGSVFSADGLALIPSTDFTISGANAETRNTVVTHATASPYIQRVFQLSNTLPPFNGAISIYYLDAELNSIPKNTLALNVHNGAVWNAYTANVTRDGVNNFVATTGLSNIAINELTLGNTTTPLPITFILFNSTCIGGGVKLTWTTAQEINSKNYHVETSTDGTNWQVIGAVPAAGNSNTERSYTFADHTSLGSTFYRIVENDLDSRQTISTTIKSSCISMEAFAIHPNPVQQMLSVAISVPKMMPVQLRLYDAKGALVKQLQTNLLKGNNELHLNMGGLTKGVYILDANWGNNNKTSKVVKE